MKKYIWKQTVKNQHIVHRGKEIRMVVDFSAETVETKVAQHFSCDERQIGQPRILYPEKILSEMKKKVKKFSNEENEDNLNQVLNLRHVMFKEPHEHSRTCNTISLYLSVPFAFLSIPTLPSPQQL